LATINTKSCQSNGFRFLEKDKYLGAVRLPPLAESIMCNAYKYAILCMLLFMQNMWRLPTTTETMYYDTENATRIKSNASLWNIGNLLIGSGQELVYDAVRVVQEGGLMPALSKSRHFHYVQDHAGGVVEEFITCVIITLLTTSTVPIAVQ
jgi:hypothetical protein